MIKYFFYLNYS